MGALAKSLGKAFERLGSLSFFATSRAETRERGPIPRLAAKRLGERRDRIVQASHFQQGHAAIAMRIGCIGLQLDRPIETGQAFDPMPRSAERDSQPRPGGKVLWIHFEGPAIAGLGFAKLTSRTQHLRQIDVQSRLARPQFDRAAQMLYGRGVLPSVKVDHGQQIPGVGLVGIGL